MLRAFADTHTGLRRKNNEDSFLCLPERGLFVVADGLGGLQYGEEASGNLVRLLEQEPDEAFDDLVSLAQRLSLAVHERGKELTADTIGTTMTLVQLRGERLRLAQVGDSSAYLWTSWGGLQVLTEEQTVAGQRLRDGLGGVEPYMHHVLTQCMGQREPVVPQLLELEFPKGARLLLCSDGITKTVSDELITEVLSESESVEQAVHCLIDMANRAGGPDNSTAVVVFA